MVKELALPGELTQNRSYDFEFMQVEKPYESYTGANVRLRYINYSAHISKLQFMWVYLGHPGVLVPLHHLVSMLSLMPKLHCMCAARVCCRTSHLFFSAPVLTGRSSHTAHESKASRDSESRRLSFSDCRTYFGQNSQENALLLVIVKLSE